LRDVGLSGAVLETVPNVLFIGEGMLLVGDTVRFRKGLFEGRLVVSPGDICLPDSVVAKGLLASARRVLWAGERFSWPILYLSGSDETRRVDKFGQRRDSVRGVVASQRLYAAKNGCQSARTCSLPMHLYKRHICKSYHSSSLYSLDRHQNLQKGRLLYGICL